MISRREKLLSQPWQQQFYEQHRLKVCSAKAAIDAAPPTKYLHIIVKRKKVQIESERLRRIEAENLRLLQNLGDIMRSKSKRLQNLWLQPRPTFLQREKLFEGHSREPKLEPKQSQSSQNSKTILKDCSSSLRTSARARRCPTCSGRPERTEVKIPAERIPWQPAPKSMNHKIQRSFNVRDNKNIKLGVV